MRCYILAKNGSNINGLVMRYKDLKNKVIDIEYDPTNPLQITNYNIYKKFDSYNVVSIDTLETCKKIAQHIELDNKLNNSNIIKLPKIKI